MIILTGCRNIYLKPRTCPHESGKVSPNPLIFISEFRAFTVRVGSHISRGLIMCKDQSSSVQVLVHSHARSEQ